MWSGGVGAEPAGRAVFSSGKADQAEVLALWQAWLMYPVRLEYRGGARVWAQEIRLGPAGTREGSTDGI